MQSLLVDYHRLTLSHMDKSFIWLEETKERINQFSIGYMINLKLNINKALREQVNKFMNTICGEFTQPHIRTILDVFQPKASCFLSLSGM